MAQGIDVRRMFALSWAIAGVLATALYTLNLAPAVNGTCFAVIGVGLNLTIGRDEFPEELRDVATSVGHGVEPAEAE